MMKGTRKASIHAEEKKKKRKRGKILDNGEAFRTKIEGKDGYVPPLNSTISQPEWNGIEAFITKLFDLFLCTYAVSEDSSVLVEKKKKKKKFSNLERKHKLKNLVGKQRPDAQVDLKEHSDGAGDDSSEAPLIEDFKDSKEIDTGLRMQARKSKKTKKKRKKDERSVKEVLNSPENEGMTDQDEIYTISSGDDDCSKGMKKWIMEYHQHRPGLQALQDQIDDFITAHEEKLEEERKEREARAAEGGWTVVVHHKGRKKTADSESGIVVGSVAQAAVEQKAAKKKNKEVALNFYRFQKKEAQRNEIVMLQSKFEEDKKRIQQLRASRKFRPY